MIAAGRRLPGAVEGALWMMAAGVFISITTGMIRPASAELHTFQVVFLRSCFALVMISPVLMRPGVRVLTSPHIRLHLLRASLFVGAMICWFMAVPLIPLVDAVALSFTAPLFATALAVLVLKEVVRLRRWSAVVIGFVGALVVLRPGFQTMELGALLVLLDSCLWAAAAIVIRLLARHEVPSAIVANMYFWSVPLTAVPAIFVWTAPSLDALMWIGALAVIAIAGHLCIARALSCAETSVVMPFEYVRLIFFAAIGYVVFDEVPEGWTLLGAAIISGAAIYILRREAQLARRPAP